VGRESHFGFLVESIQLRFSIAVFVLSSSGFAQYAGPAILSRGEAPAALQSPGISFRPYAEAAATYDGGLQGVALNNDGVLPGPQGSAGVRLMWGVSGSHSWQHTKLGLDYRGSLYEYFRVPSLDSVDQALLLGISHQFSRHTLLTLRESAGTFGRNFVLPGLSQTVPFDPVSSYIPTIDYFDQRTYYASTQADFSIQRSTRLIFDVGGDYFITRRSSAALTGVAGASARGDIEYRLTKKTSIGVNYSYAHYAYTKTLGGTDLHGFNGGYSVRLTRNLEFSAYGGVMRAESKFISLTPVDPIIQALLGITAAPQISHSINWIPNGAGRLAKKYRAGVLYFTAGHTITPGNGLFLTSFTTSLYGGYTYTGLRRWAFDAAGGYNDSNATGSITGNYRTGTASITVSRQIMRSMHVIFEAGLRQYGSADFSGYNRSVFFGRTGVGITPGDLPFRLW
jgi:hypothetical protein